MHESGARWRPQRGTVVAIAFSFIALVVSMTGVATAKIPDVKDEISLLTVATGSVEVSADGEQVQVPMVSQAFTQEAGSGIMFITSVSFDLSGLPEDQDCSGYVAWNTLGDTLFLPDTSFVTRGIWGSRQTFFLPSAAADTYYPSMWVGTSSVGECPGAGVGTYATLTVNVEVQVWAFR